MKLKIMEKILTANIFTQEEIEFLLNLQTNAITKPTINIVITIISAIITLILGFFILNNSFLS